MAQTIEVVGAVIVRDGRVFAARRGTGKPMAGYWEFPGGKVEPGEGQREALARELREELLIDVNVGEHLTTATDNSGSVIIELATYLCEVTSESPMLTEHAEARWVEPADLRQLDWAPADIPTVDLLETRFS